MRQTDKHMHRETYVSSIILQVQNKKSPTNLIINITPNTSIATRPASSLGLASPYLVWQELGALGVLFKLPKSGIA